jgi:hypothetical protein
LDKVSHVVNSTLDNFDRASEGAIRIGERLAASETERCRISIAIEILKSMEILGMGKSPVSPKDISKFESLTYESLFLKLSDVFFDSLKLKDEKFDDFLLRMDWGKFVHVSHFKQNKSLGISFILLKLKQLF